MPSEGTMLEHNRRNIYTACEDMDFHWAMKEVERFDHMWNEGLSVWDMAKSFDRDPDEVMMLIVDRIKHGKIKERPGGMWGRRMPPEEAEQCNSE